MGTWTTYLYDWTPQPAPAVLAQVAAPASAQLAEEIGEEDAFYERGGNEDRASSVGEDDAGKFGDMLAVAQVRKNKNISHFCQKIDQISCTSTCFLHLKRKKQAQNGVAPSGIAATGLGAMNEVFPDV